MVKRKLTQEELIEIYYKDKALKKAIKKAIKRVKTKKEKRESKGLRKTGKIVYNIVPGLGYEKEKEKVIKKFVKPRKSSSKEEREILRDVAEKRKRIEKKEKTRKEKIRKKDIKYRKKVVKKLFKGKSERKKVKKREKAVKGVLGAFGIVPGKASGGGAGRPRGTYKYGMPIHLYKKMLRDKKLAYQRYQQEQHTKLSTKGFTPEQIQQLQQQQAIREMQEPETEEEFEEFEEEQVQQPRPTQRKGYGRILPRSQQVRPGRSVADDELDFTQWRAEQTISPRTQRILDTIRRIQNKAKTDNIEQQRRHRERKMVSESTNLLHANQNMINVDMDFTGVPEDNILLAKNSFKESPENNILRKRRSLLDTHSYGNQLKFF